jgi:transcriptional regulator with XRE-family HTH domain
MPSDGHPHWELGSETLGTRLRALRRAAGLSQAELADGQFTKEYVSQIERGRTRPTRETVEWLARRLDVDYELLEHGWSRADALHIESVLGEGERLLEESRYADALQAFAGLREARGFSGEMPQQRLRLLRGETWAQIRSGELDAALSLLDEAANLVVTPGFSDTDRAEVVFFVGVVRCSESRIPEAIVLLDEAVVLAEGSDLPSDQLRADIFQWRARCHRLNRDWVAAHEDAERALELAEASTDTLRIGDALFQASMGAQRDGRYVLARSHAERSLELFEQLGDRATVGRLLNNLAGLNHLLGHSERAVELLRDAFEIFLELDLGVEAGYACSSLAEILVEEGAYGEAEELAVKALSLLGGRRDHVQEIGTAQLALARALTAQRRLGEAEIWAGRADRAFEEARLTSHRSYAWLAQGDIESERGNDRAAADLFRRSALALLESEEGQAPPP